MVAYFQPETCSHPSLLAFANEAARRNLDTFYIERAIYRTTLRLSLEDTFKALERLRFTFAAYGERQT